MKGILFLMLAGLCLCTAPTSKECLKKNAFLESMRVATPANVTIFPSVVMKRLTASFDHCKEEWNAHGTCCDSADLVNLFEYEKNTITHNKVKIVEAVTNYVKLVKGLVKIDKNKKQVLVRGLTEFGKVSDTCWNYIYQIRGSALCSICSGRSEIFFTKDKNKILVDTDTCRVAIDECEAFFKGISDLSYKVEYVLHHFKSQLNEEKQSFLQNLQTVVKTYGPPEYLMEAMELYEKHKVDKSHKGIHSAKVCSMFLNIRKKPFLQALDPSSQFFASMATLNVKHKRIRQLLEAVDADFSDSKLDLELNLRNQIRIAKRKLESNVIKIRQRSLPSKQLQSMLATEDSNYLVALGKINNDFGIKFHAAVGDKNSRVAKLAVVEKTAYDAYQNELKLIKMAHSIGMLFANGVKVKGIIGKLGSRSLLGQSNFRKLELLEHEESNEDSMFVSDSSVFIKNTDSMFASFVGVTNDDGGNFFQPMNVSLAFP